LMVSREPLEAGWLVGALGRDAWARATSLVPWLSTTAERDELEVLDALCAWSTHRVDDLDAQARAASLHALVAAPSPNPTVLGAAEGLLYDDGALDGAHLGHRLAGLLGGNLPSLGARYLGGLLRAARSVMWQEPAVTRAIHQALHELDRLTFLRTLPHLRLAFSDLTPTETERVAQAVRGGPDAPPSVPVDEHGARADRLVRAALAADGLDRE